MNYEDAKKIKGKACKDKTPIPRRSAATIAKHGGPGKVLHSKENWERIAGKGHKTTGKITKGK